MERRSMQLEILATPQPKLRPRFTRSGKTFTPQKTREYEELIRAAYISQYGNEPMYGRDEALAVNAEFWFVPPKSWSVRKTKAALASWLPHTSRQDIDNLLKAILDALRGLAYVDDTQVVQLNGLKRYASEPYIRVTLTPCDIQELIYPEDLEMFPL